MRMAKVISASAVLLTALVGRAGDSVPLTIDLRETRNIDSLTLNWDASWVGGDSDATVVIADNGVEVKRATGVGEFVYNPSTTGRHELTYTTLVYGVAQDEVYTATFFKYWKYEVRDGGAVIVDTTCKTGDVIVPLDLDGYPVVGIEGAFVGCSDIASVSMQGSPESYSSFIGWFTEKTGGQQATIETIVTDATVVYPRWTANGYEVSFDAAGGAVDWGTAGAPCIKVVAFGAEYGELPTATRTGYTFNGWKMDDELVTSDMVVKTANDHTLVAQWTANEYTVTFDANGGSVSGPSVTVTYGAAYGELPTATRARYTFDGWKLNDEVVASDTIIKTANDHTLVAQWTANSYSVHGKTFHVDDIVYSGYIGDEHALEEDEDYLGDVLYVRSKTGEQVAYVTTPWGSYEFHDVTSSSGDITSGAGLFVCTMNSPAGDELHLEFILAANWADDNGITHSTYFYEASTATKYFMCSGQRYRFGEDGPALSLLQKDVGTYYLAIDQNSDELGWAGHDFKSVSRLEDADLVMKVTESGVVTVSGSVNGVAISADCICTCASDSYWETIWVDFVQVVSPGRVAYIEGHLSPIGPSLIAAGINFLDVSSKIYPRVDIIPELAGDSGAADVDAVVDGVGFADEGVKAAIGGSAAEYAAFKEWAGSVKGAGSAGSAAAGEAVVVANTNAAAAYLLGAERLFENAPVVEIGEVVVWERTSGTGGSGETGEAGGTAGTGGSEGTGTSISVTVTVKDGEEAVKCAAEKVAAMFEATGDLGDWAGEAKMLPTVTVEEGDGSTMRFKVTPGDGTAPRAFLRIRK